MPTMGTPTQSRRDFQGLEQLRFVAAKLFAAGTEPDGAIARRLGVSRQIVDGGATIDVTTFKKK